MNAVTGYAGRHVKIAVLQSLPVNARVILLHLVDPEGRVELLHQSGVTMTLSAERGNLCGSWFTDVTLHRVFGGFFVFLCCITTVAIGTREPSLFMYVVVKKLGRLSKSLVSQS